MDLDMRRKRSADETCVADSDCGDDARCANTQSGLRCVCNDGFTGDGEICARVALDACSRLNPCPQDVLCFPDDQDQESAINPRIPRILALEYLKLPLRYTFWQIFGNCL